MAMSRQRGYQAKRRNTGERKRKRLILLSAEGKNKTETQYFTDMARALNLNIRFAPGNYTDPVHMVDALKKACRDNDLGVNDKIEEGDILWIRKRHTAIHIVKPLETFESIAKSYNVSVSHIKEVNHIDTIFIGQKIII